MEDKAFNTYLKQKNKEIGVMERRAKELIRQTKYNAIKDREVEKEIRLLYERIQKECAVLSAETLERAKKTTPK
jgi:hypothetical protein